jgi:phosphonate transport system permease protein
MTRQKTRTAVVEAPSFVPPAAAAVASLILPGLGQMLTRAFRRGLLILFSMATMIGLLIWRVSLIGRRETGWLAITQKAFDLQPLTLVLTILILILYLGTAADAYLQARRPRKGLSIVFILVLAIFFGLGWQIGQIEPAALAQGAKDGGPILLQIMWPWEKATARAEEMRVGGTPIEVPCGDEPLEPPPPVEGQPYLVAEPNCGIATDEEGNAGTLLTLTGSGFSPDIESEVWWEDPLHNPFRQRVGGQALTVTPDENGEFQIQAVIPYRLIPPSAAAGPLLWRVEVRQPIAAGPLQPSPELITAIQRMIETIFLGMMATFFGIILAIPVSFLAARNLMSANPFTLAIYFLSRTVLNIIRSIEPLIWAVIAIIVVGLGPFAGILALTLHSIAALGKLYSESIESIDPGPIEAIQATGANWFQTVMYAVVPQVIPPFVSFTIYRWDINVRMSTVIGLVGGGGIGFVLIQWIRLFDYKAAGIAVWFIAITVAILDYVSSEIRRRFV